MQEDQIKVRSLQKAIEILNCFADKRSLGVTEISNMLGLYKSNVYNILSTYKALGYLDQDPQTGLYSLGTGIFKLSKGLDLRFSAGKIAQPYMQELANVVEENVFIAIPHEDNVLYLDAAYPVGRTNMIREIRGYEAKMYCTGLGKAIMAYLEPSLIEEYASRQLTAFTENTITNKELLIKELEKIRKSGFAIDNMEHEFGVKCVAVPVFNRLNQVIAGLSITGQASVMSEKIEKKSIMLKLKETALNIQKHI